MNEIAPTVRYLIVCEDVQVDPENPYRITLVGLLSAIHALGPIPYPLLQRELCVFLQLTECRGPARGHVELQHADSGRSFSALARERCRWGTILSRSWAWYFAFATACSQLRVFIGYNSCVRVRSSRSSPCC